jgi:hypothetical protein
MCVNVLIIEMDNRVTHRADRDAIFIRKRDLKRTFIDYRGFLVFCEDNESPILTSNNEKSRIGITERVLMVKALKA